MLLQGLMSRFVKGQATNSTDSSFSATNTISTYTKPAASATRTVIVWEGPLAVKDRNTLKVIPYGGNDNNDVINVKVMGWSSLPDLSNPAQDPLKLQWVSRAICLVQCTLSSSLPGLAGGHVLSTEFFADTLALTSGTAALHTGTLDVDTAWFECDISGFEIIEVRGAVGAGGDTMNWLISAC